MYRQLYRMKWACHLPTAFNSNHLAGGYMNIVSPHATGNPKSVPSPTSAATGPVKYVWYMHSTAPTQPITNANSAANPWGSRSLRFQISQSKLPLRKMNSSCKVIVIQMMVQYPIKLSQLMKMSNSESRPAIATIVNTIHVNVLHMGRGIFAHGPPSCCQFSAAAYVPGMLLAAMQTARMTQQKFPKAWSGLKASTTSAPMPWSSKARSQEGLRRRPEPRPMPRNSISSLPVVMPQVVAAKVPHRLVVLG